MWSLVLCSHFIFLKTSVQNFLWEVISSTTHKQYECFYWSMLPRNMPQIQKSIWPNQGRCVAWRLFLSTLWQKQVLISLEATLKDVDKTATKWDSKLQKAKVGKENWKSSGDIFWVMDQAVTDLQLDWSYLPTSGSSNFVLSFENSFMVRNSDRI